MKKRNNHQKDPYIITCSDCNIWKKVVIPKDKTLLEVLENFRDSHVESNPECQRQAIQARQQSLISEERALSIGTTYREVS